jgi:hypothetical protein
MPCASFWRQLPEQAGRRLRRWSAARNFASTNVASDAAHTYRLDAALLEDRILYSAAPLPTVDAADGADAGGIDMLDDVYLNDLFATAHFDQPHDLHENGWHLDQQSDHAQADSTVDVVLVDTQLDDSELLADAALPGSHVFRYDSTLDSAESILRDVAVWAVENGTEIGSLSILSHGTAGAFQLGSDWITDATLADTADAWQSLASHMASGADIYLLGCNVGETAGGQRLVDHLATLTDADVFGSDDVTGIGGDWVLEIASAGDEADAGTTLGLPLSVSQLEAADVSLAWFDANWQFRQNIVVSEAMVPDVSDLTDFAVLVTVTDLNLRSTFSGGNVGQNDGGDFVFTSADGSTQLDHEIESYDPTTGELVAWVEVPTLSFGTDTSLYIYYGNAAAANQWDIAGTWDASFRGVWHLGGDVLDSTANGNDGTNNGTTNFANAKIGDGDDFDGASDYITTTSTEARTADEFTISLWFNSDATDFAHQILWQGDAAGDGWGSNATHREMHISMGTVDDGVTMGNQLSFFLGDDADPGNDPLEIYTAFNDTAGWHHVTVVVSDMSGTPTTEMYVDGGTIGTDTSTVAEASRATWDTPLRFGRPGQNARHYDGGLDEVRLATTARSAEWIATEFNNQDDPGAYVTFSVQQAMQTIVVAVDDASTTPEDTPVVIDLDANDTDAEGDVVTVIDFTQPGTGTVTDNGDGTVTYTPVGDDSGGYTFDYMAIDAGAGLAHFWGLNGDAVDAVGGSDGTVTGATTSAGSFGTALDFDKTDDFVEIPDFAYMDNFSVSFEFMIDDNSGGDFQYFYSHGDPDFNNSINIYVGEVGSSAPNQLRTVVADNNDALDFAALDFDISGLVGDATWHTYTLVVRSAGANVYLDGVARTSANYGGDAIDPIGDLHLGIRENEDLTRVLDGRMDNVMVFNRDLLAEEVTDLHGQTNRGSATVTVTAVNDAPVVTAPAGALAATEQVGLAIHGTGFGVSDVDEAGLGATATLTVGEGAITVVVGDSGVTVDSGDGTGTVTLSGTVAELNNLLTGGGTGTITYLNGSDDPSASTLLTVTVNDTGNVGADPGLTGDGTSEEGTNSQTINIAATNDAPALATNTGLNTTQGATDPIGAAQLAVADPDSTPAQLTYTVTVGPTAGQLELTTAPGVAVGTFTQDDLDNNRVVYVHEGSSTAADSFTFTIADGAGGSLGATAFNITIATVNQAPTAADNAFSLVATPSLAVAAPGVLAGDADPDGDPLTAVLVAGPASGSLTLNADGSFTYTPNTGFVGTDTFQYRASDGSLDSGAATVRIDVIPAITQPPPESPDSGDGTGDGGTGTENTENSEGDSDSNESTTDDSSTDSDSDARRRGGRRDSGDRRSSPVLDAPVAPTAELLANLVVVDAESTSNRQGDDIKKTIRKDRASTPKPADTAERPEPGFQAAANFDTLDLWHALDTLGDEIDSTDRFGELVAGTATVLTGALSTGYIAWAARGGYLMAGMLSSIPTWRFLDPLPILSSSALPTAADTDDNERNLSLADLLRERHLTRQLKADSQ